MAINLDNVIFDSCMLYYGDIDVEEHIADLPSHLQGKELGLSDSGVKFSSTPDVRQIPFAGALDRKIKGFERILKVEGTIEGEIIPINGDTLEMCLYKKGSKIGTTHDKYTPQTGVIDSSAYKNLLAVGTTASGDTILILIKNTFNEELNADTKDKDENKTKVKFEGRYDSPSSEPPIAVYIPTEG